MDIIEHTPSQTLATYNVRYRANLEVFNRMLSTAQKVRETTNIRFDIDPSDERAHENIAKFLQWVASVATAEQWREGVELGVRDIGAYAGRSNSPQMWAAACRAALVRADENRPRAKVTKYKLSHPHLRALAAAMAEHQAYKAMRHMAIMEADEQHIMALSAADNLLDDNLDPDLDFSKKRLK